MHKPIGPTFARVPAVCPGGTVLCIASGPSLTQADVDFCRGKIDAAVAVNTSYQACSWATALYAADSDWWAWHKGVKDFAGERYSVSREAERWGVSILRNTGVDGLEQSPDGLRTGRNSGYQAINLAVHYGAKRIVLLGYDMRTGAKGKRHWHADHPRERQSPFDRFLVSFATLVKPLAELGIEVINCTRDTALTCFERRAIEAVL